MIQRAEPLGAGWLDYARVPSPHGYRQIMPVTQESRDESLKRNNPPEGRVARPGRGRGNQMFGDADPRKSRAFCQRRTAVLRTGAAGLM